mmetsp:Transcript_30184/g.33735  ORF Transcript_30184/g.33735 Transcript_30184/m.33735 type:complete len:180 (+) Transcript_30184:1444-1983(+)
MLRTSIRFGGLARVERRHRGRRYTKYDAKNLYCDTTKVLLDAKKHKGLTFADLGKAMDRSEMFAASVVYRQASCTQTDSDKLLKALGISEDQLPEFTNRLTDYPTKGLASTDCNDPAITRFFEMIKIYGFPLKAVMHEKFGDGIMSAIDFEVHMTKEKNPNGDRVKITLDGKFLPYKKF